MKIERVEFLSDHKVGAQEARSGFATSPPKVAATGLPIPEKAGVEIHLVADGDWVLVRETGEKGAAKLIPRERVKEITLTPEQAAAFAKGKGT